MDTMRQSPQDHKGLGFATWRLHAWWHTAGYRKFVQMHSQHCRCLRWLNMYLLISETTLCIFTDFPNVVFNCLFIAATLKPWTAYFYWEPNITGLNSYLLFTLRTQWSKGKTSDLQSASGFSVELANNRPNQKMTVQGNIASYHGPFSAKNVLSL